MTRVDLEVIAVALAVLVNLPFGAYRATVPRLTWRWLLAIHLPIPLLIALRFLLGLGWWFVPFMVGGAVAGQLLGSWLWGRWRDRRASESAATVD